MYGHLFGCCMDWGSEFDAALGCQNDAQKRERRRAHTVCAHMRPSFAVHFWNPKIGVKVLICVCKLGYLIPKTCRDIDPAELRGARHVKNIEGCPFRFIRTETTVVGGRVAFDPTRRGTPMCFSVLRGNLHVIKTSHLNLTPTCMMRCVAFVLTVTSMVWAM
jgi:hypothetical protein